MPARGESKTVRGQTPVSADIFGPESVRGWSAVVRRRFGKIN